MAGNDDDGGYGERENQRVTTLARVAKIEDKLDKWVDKLEQFLSGGGHAPDGPSKPAGGPPPAGAHQTQAQRAEVSGDQLRAALGDLRKQEAADEAERAAAQEREDRLAAVEKELHDRETPPQELRWLTEKLWGGRR